MLQRGDASRAGGQGQPREREDRRGAQHEGYKALAEDAGAPWLLEEGVG
jgi:hypothetical protein